MVGVWGGEKVVVDVHVVDAIVPGVVPDLTPDIPVVVENDGIGNGQESVFQAEAGSAFVIVAVTRANGIREAQEPPANTKGTERTGAPTAFDALAVVDQDGVTLTDEKIAEKYWESEFPRTHREEDDEDYSSDVLPDKFKYADTDDDGKISAAEITTLVHNFVEGKSKASKKEIKKIIDYYFSKD